MPDVTVHWRSFTRRGWSTARPVVVERPCVAGSAPMACSASRAQRQALDAADPWLRRGTMRSSEEHRRRGRQRNPNRWPLVCLDAAVKLVLLTTMTTATTPRSTRSKLFKAERSAHAKVQGRPARCWQRRKAEFADLELEACVSIWVTGICPSSADPGALRWCLLLAPEPLAHAGQTPV